MIAVFHLSLCFDA